MVKVGCVIDRPITAKRHIEFATTIKTTESVKTGAIQIVEQLGCFRSLAETLLDQFIKSAPMLVEQLFVISRLNLYCQTALSLSIKVN